MKIIGCVLYLMAVGLGVLGQGGHSTVWAAAATAFFAAAMIMVGQRKNKGIRDKSEIDKQRA